MTDKPASDQTTNVTTELGDRMRALAATGHPRVAELIEKAAAFDAASPATAGDAWDVKKMLGTWARARRVWTECSGEPLI